MDTQKNIRLKKSAQSLFIEAPGHGSSLCQIRSVITDLARQIHFSEDEVAKIEMAVDEACSNVVEHAYSPGREWIWKQRDPEIRLEIHTEHDRLIILISDHGQRFDFAAYRPADLLERIHGMHRGGYGISIMRRFMDEVEYKSDDKNGNTLRLVKYLKKS